MTAEATLAPENRLRNRALDLLRTATLEVMLDAEEPLRTVDVARLVAERLGLTLSDEEAGGLASVVRMVLDSDPLFSQSNRQWDLALRMGRAEGDRRKPVERAIEDFIDLLGHPVSSRPVSVLVAGVYGRLPDYYEKMLQRIVPTSTQFFPVDGGRLAIRRWLLELSSDDPEDVEYDNFEDTTLLEALRQVADGLDGGSAVEFARSLVRRAGEPVDNRALQFLAWSRFPDTDPAQLFRGLLADSELALERGPSWVTAEARGEVLDAIREMTRDPQAITEALADSVPAEEEEIGFLASTTARVSDEDLEQVYEFMASEERTYRLQDLLQQVLEAFPGSRTYGDMHESLGRRMGEDDRFQWVGAERYRLRGTIPAEVEYLPPGLGYDETVYLGEDEEEVDRIVQPQDWKAGLDEQIRHYLVQDVGDDSSDPPGRTPTEITVSQPLHHFVAGTLYLRTADRGFFPTEPDLVQVSVEPTTGDRFDVWINNRLQLVLGLKDWYEANLPWVGGQFTLQRREQADEYRLVYNGETDPLMDIPLDRLQQLLSLRNEAVTERLPLMEIVQRILKMHPEGVPFVTLFTEVNVVRRVRRAQVASVLSSQRYFAPVPQQAGSWMFDEKRAQRGKGKKKGGPRRPMREYDYEDEDLGEEIDLDE